MTEIKQNSPARDWLEAELADTLDEDYELEISEPAPSIEIAKMRIRHRSTACSIFAISSRCNPN